MSIKVILCQSHVVCLTVTHKCCNRLRIIILDYRWHLYLRSVRSTHCSRTIIICTLYTFIILKYIYFNGLPHGSKNNFKLQKTCIVNFLNVAIVYVLSVFVHRLNSLRLKITFLTATDRKRYI